MVVEIEGLPIRPIKGKVEAIRKPKSYVSVIEPVAKDGHMVNTLVIKELTPETDIRSKVTADDWNLDVVIANGTDLRECPSFTGNTFDNIDRIDNTIEQLETYKEDL